MVIIRLKANLRSNWTGLGLDWTGTELGNVGVKTTPRNVKLSQHPKIEKTTKPRKKTTAKVDE